LHISAEELIRTPRGYPEPWRRVFEVFVAPIKLVRAIGFTALNNSGYPKFRWPKKKCDMWRPANNSPRHVAATKNMKPWLSLEEFKDFQQQSIKVNQQILELLDQINGVAERTWRAGAEIRRSTGTILFRLSNGSAQERPEHWFVNQGKDIISACLNYLPIPSLIMLRNAIAAEQRIELPSATVDTKFAPSGAVSSKAPLSPTRHSDDFRSVHWFGHDYSFTKTQAPCIEFLWKNWENGTPEVGNFAILQAARSEQNRLPDVFKRKGEMHAAWGTMIVSCPTNKGAYRLQELGNLILFSKSPRKSP